MFHLRMKIESKISEILNKLNHTECKDSKYCNDYECLAGMNNYIKCCGWINKSYKSK